MEEIAAKLESIWEKDLLGRRQDAQYLGNYLSKRFQLKPDEPGFVLAVDGEWGFGKSFMIKRWQEEFALQNYPTVFFNAWENDYTDDPLLAFIAELNTGLEDFFEHVPKINGIKSGVKRTLEKAFVPVMKAAGLAITKKALGIGFDEIKEIKEILSETVEAESENHSKVGKADVKELSEKVQEAFKKALESHKTKKAAIVDFRSSLSDLIAALRKEAKIQLPLFVFVDELDRCRPNYAIELLEGIKHLFGVPGVYFVVATNTLQLSESVRAVYGNGFDGLRYLKRFFDMQYLLPEPSNEQFARSLFGDIEIPKFDRLITGLDVQDMVKLDANSADELSLEVLVHIFSRHANAFSLGLRDQKQIIHMLEVAFVSLEGKKVHVIFLIFLAVLYHRDIVAFNKLVKEGKFEGEIFGKVKSSGNDGQIVRNGAIRSDRSLPTVVQHDLVDVCDFYVRNRRSEMPALTQRQINIYDFPNNLLVEPDGVRDGKYFVHDFSKYPQLIRHAGGFSGR